MLKQFSMNFTSLVCLKSLLMLVYNSRAKKAGTLTVKDFQSISLVSSAYELLASLS